MEALILVATSGGPVMFARIGVKRALNRTLSECSIQIARITTGAGGSWQEIDDGSRIAYFSKA
jgi:uncharacterized membrane protein YeiH